MLFCHIRDVSTRTINVIARLLHRTMYTAQQSTIAQVGQLPDWDLDQFRQNAFKANTPKTLPFMKAQLPPACHKWFIHDDNPNHPFDRQPIISELRTSFWSKYEDTMVPLELTSSSPSPITSTSTETSNTTTSTFHRTEAPLKLLLTYLSNSPPPPTQSQNYTQTNSIYLAQCSLPSLPPTLQNDIPTPTLITTTSKGDIYSSSLWLGKPPTYTPLHKDPNPNLLLQLAGHKKIRLFPPDIGNAIFENVQLQLHSQQSPHSRITTPSSSASSASFRGEEMMSGPETSLLHDIVWNMTEQNEALLAYASEAVLGPGEAIFIPLGWWHSVKGIRREDGGGGGGGGRKEGGGNRVTGVTASVNWWFR